MKSVQIDTDSDEYFELDREVVFLRLALLIGLIIAVAVCSGRCGG